MPSSCLDGHTWDDDGDERTCVECGATEPTLTGLTLSMAPSDDAEPPYREDELDEDETKAGDDDALIIDADETTSSEPQTDRGSERRSPSTTDSTDTQPNAQPDTESNTEPSTRQDPSSTGTPYSPETAADDDDAAIIDADSGSDDSEEDGFDPDSFNGDVNKANDDAIITSSNSDDSDTTDDGGARLPPKGKTSRESKTLVCTNCSYYTSTDGETLRSGDVCPQCRTGFVEER